MLWLLRWFRQSDSRVLGIHVAKALLSYICSVSEQQYTRPQRHVSHSSRLLSPQVLFFLLQRAKYQATEILTESASVFAGSWERDCVPAHRLFRFQGCKSALQLHQSCLPPPRFDRAREVALVGLVGLSMALSSHRRPQQRGLQQPGRFLAAP